MKLAPYPKYKPSGVEWLGEVPEHWEVKRLKYSTSINDEALPETTDPGFEMSYVDISSVDQIRGIVTVEDMVFEDAPSRARRVVRDEDTIVSTVRTYLRAIAPVSNPASNTIVERTLARRDAGLDELVDRESAFLAELEDRQLLVGEILRTSGDAEVSDGFQGGVQEKVKWGLFRSVKDYSIQNIV